MKIKENIIIPDGVKLEKYEIAALNALAKYFSKIIVVKATNEYKKKTPGRFN